MYRVRGRSAVGPLIHSAFYLFESLDCLDTVMVKPDIAALVAEFDRCWHGRVIRTRDVLAVADEIGEPQDG